MSVGFRSVSCVCGRGPVTRFIVHRDDSGRQKRTSVCVACREDHEVTNRGALIAKRVTFNRSNRTKKAIRDAARKAEGKAFVDAFKSKPCADCGREFPPVAMDLDHVRGTKFRNVASLVSGAYRLELIRIELDKCDVVCACCHRIRTATRGENSFPGTAEPIQKPKRVTAPLRNVVLITMNGGETLSITEWAKRIGIPAKVASYRLRQGYSIEQAFSKTAYNSSTSPIVLKRSGKTITAFGETLPISEWAKRAGLAYATVKQRILLGWTPEDAVSAAAYGRAD